MHRAFTDLLKTDRTQFGAGEDYVIADTIADDWQQQVDNVVRGIVQAGDMVALA